MYRRRFSRFPRRKIIRRRRGLRNFRKKSLGLKKMIKKIVNRKIETKEMIQLTNGTLYEQINYTGFQGQTFNLMPYVSQGTGDGQRIGDKIQPVGLSLNFWVSRSQMWAQSHCVRVIIFSVKDYNADIMGATLPSIEAQNFFRNGTITSSVNGYLGNDCLLPVNRNRIIVHYDKLKYIGNNQSAVNLTSDFKSATTAVNPYAHFKVNVGKHMKKLIYDENGVNPNLPTNHNLFVAFVVNSADNALGSGTTAVLNYNCVAHLKYKDA